MASVTFTQNLNRYLSAPSTKAAGGSVREALDRVFDQNQRLRGYILDDQGALRKHIVIFIDGQLIKDRIKLSDPIDERSELFVMQALSGG